MSIRVAMAPLQTSTSNNPNSYSAAPLSDTLVPYARVGPRARAEDSACAVWDPSPLPPGLRTGLELLPIASQGLEMLREVWQTCRVWHLLMFGSR